MAVRWWHICDYKPTALVHIWTEEDETASNWNEIWIWVCRDGLVIFSVNEVDCLTNEYYLAGQNGTASSFESRDGTHYYIKTGGWALRMFASTDNLTEQPVYYIQKLLNQAYKYTKKWARLAIECMLIISRASKQADSFFSFSYSISLFRGFAYSSKVSLVHFVM